MLGQARLLVVHAIAVRWQQTHVPSTKHSERHLAAAKYAAMQVLYNAQMIRTWSLLLRNAQRLGYIVSGRQVSKHFPLHQAPVCSPCDLMQNLKTLHPCWT